MRYSRPQEEEEVEFRVRAIAKSRSGLALLCEEDEGSWKRWVPFSQMRLGTEVRDKGDEGLLIVTGWLAGKWEEEGDGDHAQPSDPGVEVPGCVCLRESAGAIMVRVPEQEKPIWVPKACVLGSSEVKGDGDVGKLVLTRSMASQKGLGSDSGEHPSKGDTVEDDILDEELPF